MSMYKKYIAAEIIAGFLVFFCWAGNASAQLNIVIEEGVSAGVPIAIVPFEWRNSAPPPQPVSDIVEADLKRSGRFSPITQQDFLSRPHDHTGVKYKDWRLIKAEFLVVGKMQQVGGDSYLVQFQLFDVFKQSQLGGYRYTVNGATLRRLAHQIADIIYLKVLGERGAFDTRIAYVTAQGRGRATQYKLMVADSDGYGPKTIVSSNEPLLSPSWSPDGEFLAYVSFEKRRSMIFVQRLRDGKRQLVAASTGINGAPSWSPDGRKLAYTSSRDGNPEIYVLDLHSKAQRRLTNHHAIDTEPDWSPDGSHLVFTSDRGGRPQIYRMAADGSGVTRLTFRGDYNARASYSPDGKTLTLVTRDGKGFRIGIFLFENKEIFELTKAQLDESPSFAPNGSMVLYATNRGNTGVLAAVSVDGRVKQLLRFQEGDVREPAWSPYNHQL